MKVWNYTALKQRDKKIYSIGGSKISSTGISISWLKIVAPCTLLTTILGVIIAALIGKMGFYRPLSGEFNLTYVLLSVCSGLGLGLALWYVKLESYRLYEYLYAYFRPKKVYHNLNTVNREQVLHKININSIIRADL